MFHIKPKPKWSLPLPGLLMFWWPLPRRPLSSHVCLRAPLCPPTKQATDRGWERFGKEWTSSVGYPRGDPDWDHRHPWDADPTLGTLEVDTGVGNWCPSDACSAVMWPCPTGWLSTSQRTGVLTRNLPYCERLHWAERNIFIKRSAWGLLGKLWGTRFVCSGFLSIRLISSRLWRSGSKTNFFSAVDKRGIPGDSSHIPSYLL